MSLVFRVLFVAALVTLGVGGALLLFGRTETRRLTIAAGSPESEGYELADAIGRVAERYHSRVEIAVAETRGSDEIMRLIDRGQVDLGIVQASVAPVDSARLVVGLYPDVFHLIVRQGSGIRSVADLSGRTVALPQVGSGQYTAFWILAEHYGLTDSDLVALPMSNNAARYALASDAVDAVFRVRPPGNRDIRELVRDQGSSLVGIDQAAAMKLAQPSLEIGTIPRGAYRGFPPLPESNLPTVAVQTLLIARAGLDEALVYALTQLLFDRRRDLVDLTPIAGFISFQDPTSGSFLPLHPGAQRYYDREKPSFLQQNAEPLALLLSIVALVVSAVFRLTSQRRKRRLDLYNRELLLLYQGARGEARDVARLEQRRDRLMSVLGRVVDDAEEGRITSEGFHIFSFIWGAVDDAIRERLGAASRTAE